MKSHKEKARIADLLRMLPKGRSTALEIGARDGYMSHLLAEHFEHLYALDLHVPNIIGANITAIQGDITRLELPDEFCDVCVCCEVLEHISPLQVATACKEIVRVIRYEALIGVPYRQDLRVGRTICQSCGKNNPPWGHVNSFDEMKLRSLFKSLRLESISYVGRTNERTNFLSSFLMDIGGNPFGTYEQEELCIYCGNQLVGPADRNIFHKLSSWVACYLNRIQLPFVSTSPEWVHILFTKEKVRPSG